jgi:pSer/pThr/pTyr-binding forkhead associated (FHA) protein
MATDTIHPHIEALTEQAEKAIGGPQLTIDRSPFRFGRESRDPDSKGWLSNRRMFAGPNNECYMHDTGYFRQISREHFQIRQSEDGSYWLEDRGSSCGTWVNDTRLHGASNKIELRNGHKIVVGTIESPYAYTFVATASR